MKHTRMLKLAVKPQGMQEKGKDLKGKEKHKKEYTGGKGWFSSSITLAYSFVCHSHTLTDNIPQN